MSRRRILAEHAARQQGVSKPTIVSSGNGYFYVRLPGSMHPIRGWDEVSHSWRPFPYTHGEALARVARYYKEIR